jgi:sulfite dehydrogenase (quinone) subunit SoeC
MHPAYSVILFTTASGAGYGLLFWQTLGIQTGYLPDDRWLNLAMLVPALALITIGLLSSMLHLGHPERAHRAMSQWRSSWLSREGVAALFTYLPASLMGLIWLFDMNSKFIPALAVLAETGALITVYCTGMIYASLRTIRHWNLGLVPLFYLAAAAATGGLLLLLIQSIFARTPDWAVMTGLGTIALAMIVKLVYWRKIDGNKGQYTAEMATGLGALGMVRPLDPPHTMPNFVMREMGYRVGRKHAVKLRRIAVAMLFVLPIAMVLLAIFSGWPQLPLLAIATLSAAIGVVVERWLFFAEAEHVAMLYYGAARA